MHRDNLSIKLFSIRLSVNVHRAWKYSRALQRALDDSTVLYFISLTVLPLVPALPLNAVLCRFVALRHRMNSEVRRVALLNVPLSSLTLDFVLLLKSQRFTVHLVEPISPTNNCMRLSSFPSLIYIPSTHNPLLPNFSVPILTPSSPAEPLSFHSESIAPSAAVPTDLRITLHPLFTTSGPPSRPSRPI